MLLCSVFLILSSTWGVALNVPDAALHR